MIRLRKPLAYYKKKYGSVLYPLRKLYLLMEKQHNRGQEAAGIGVVKLHGMPGNEYVFRERAMGSGAITEIFSKVFPLLSEIGVDSMTDDEAEVLAPFLGEILMGHLRYSTTGKSGISYVHPFLRRNNWRSRNLLMCGNFNLTNVHRVFDSIVARGQHPRIYSDTVVLLEQLGYELDKENHRIYRDLRNTMVDPELAHAIEDRIDLTRVLRAAAPAWDGGFVICGATGSGDMFALRDSHGIRPAYYYIDPEVVVVTSERPVVQTVFDAPLSEVHELEPGNALIVRKRGDVGIHRILPEDTNARCSFERIYFSRGNDTDIYRERKSLGHILAPAVSDAVDGDLEHTVLSFIPNTAEVAFMGLSEGLQELIDRDSAERIADLSAKGTPDCKLIGKILSRRVRTEKVAWKDIKLRTFIAEGSSRNDLAAHVYDITYGSITPGVDNLVIIDDSIVRGTTLRQSIITMLARLNPKKIVVVSSSPQVRYPDYYGIDMSRLGEFVAFRAAIALLRERGMQQVIEDTYAECLRQLSLPDDKQINAVRAIYAPFTAAEISEMIARMVTPEGTSSKVQIIYQSLQGLHEAVPGFPGDWYFSGRYPTPGGNRLVNQAFVDFYEGHSDRRND